MSGLTSNEQSLLNSNGVFFTELLMPLVAESVFWGIYVVAFTLSMHYLLSRKRPITRPRIIMIALTVLLFAMSTLLLILQTYIVMLRGIHNLFARYEDGQWVRGPGFLPDAVLPAIFTSECIFPIEFLIGDAVVIWRTWVLWNPSYAMLLPCMMWLTSLVLLVTERIMTLLSGAVQDETIGLSPLAQRLAKTSFSLSIATNAVSTTMIGYKSWIYRRSIRGALGMYTGRTWVERVLALLIESGLIYLCFWAVQLIIYFDLPPGPATVFRNVWQTIGQQAVGLYPTIVIMLVELQRTMQNVIDSPGGTNLSSSETPHPPSSSQSAWRDLSIIRFAATHSQGEDEVEYEAIALEPLSRGVEDELRHRTQYENDRDIRS